MCIRIIPRWSLTSSLHSLALRTEPICSRNKCREHQSVRGVRWRKWKTHKDGRQRTTQFGRTTMVGSIPTPHIPKNCNLRKFVHLLSKVLRKAYTRNSSAGRRIGCMLRQHSFSLRLVALLSLRRGNILGERYVEI